VDTTLTIHRKHLPGQFTRVTMGDRVVSCGHPRVLLDEVTLDLECGECKAPIDIRLFVLEWAQKLRRLEYSRETVKRLGEERAELERQIRNLKAQRRREERKP
jgi:hypothetical protein